MSPRKCPVCYKESREHTRKQMDECYSKFVENLMVDM
jgi:hypothetical protein